MLTSYAGCWGSFMLRGLSIALFGALLTASPRLPLELLVPALSVVLIAAGANAASVGLRLRPLGGGWWLLALEGALTAAAGLAALLRPDASAMVLVASIAAVAVAGGLYQLSMARRHGRGAQSIWPAAAAGGLSLGHAALLAALPLVVTFGNALPIGLAASALGTAFVVMSLRLRGLQRAARRERLRDAPLACRPVANRMGAPREATPVPSNALTHAA